MLSGRLALIRRKLHRLKAIDERRDIFGAGGEHGHHYREKAPLNEAELRHLEQGYGITLPEEIRAFLNEVHGGGAGPGYGMDIPVLTVPQPRTARPFLYDSRAAADILARRQAERFTRLPLFDDSENDSEDDEYGWPPGPGFIRLAHHGCGAFSVLVVSGDQRGMVWFCDMGWLPEHSERGQFGFLDWYEDWLDRHLPREV